MQQGVRNSFKPEFLNRLDEIILFNRIERENMASIVDIQFKRVQELLVDKQITVTLDSKAREYLAEGGYDPVYGARPLKRVIQNEVQNKLAEMYLGGQISEGSKLVITADKSGIAIKKPN
jgi:ATP-dependent Clp protease ATP-binding subunit ClpB